MITHYHWTIGDTIHARTRSTAKPGDALARPSYDLVVKKVLVTSYHYLSHVGDTSHLTRSQQFFNRQHPTNHARMVTGSNARAISRAHKLIAVPTTTRH